MGAAAIAETSRPIGQPENCEASSTDVSIVFFGVARSRNLGNNTHIVVSIDAAASVS